jgi:hypothetical protein
VRVGKIEYARRFDGAAFRFQDDRHVAAVTGGTGAYAGANGWIESRTAPGGDPSVNEDVIHLLP